MIKIVYDLSDITHVLILLLLNSYVISFWSNVYF